MSERGLVDFLTKTAQIGYQLGEAYKRMNAK